MRPRHIFTILAICLLSLGACKSNKNKTMNATPADEPAAAPDQLPDDGVQSPDETPPVDTPPAAEQDEPAPMPQQPVEVPQDDDQGSDDQLDDE